MKLLVLLSLACTSAWAQATSQIQGTVQDASGSAVPGAEVKATQTETSLVRMVTTSSDGTYILANLPIGPYRDALELANRAYVLELGRKVMAGAPSELRPKRR